MVKQDKPATDEDIREMNILKHEIAVLKGILENHQAVIVQQQECIHRLRRKEEAG